AYGATFSSQSDKYLNIVSIKNIKKSYNKKSPTAYGSLFLPYELFHSLEIVPFLPEVIAGFTGGLGITDRTLKEASSKWYTPDLCTFHRCASGAVELDLFPIPPLLICATLACDAAQKTFYIDAKKYGIEDNFYLVDVPYEKNSKSISYLAEQFKMISKDISTKLQKNLDFARLENTIKLSNEFRYWALKVNDLRKELSVYPKNFNGLNFIFPFHGLAGTKDAVILYKNIYRELKKLLDKQKNKKIKTDRIKRLLWLHLKPYYKNEIFTLLEKNNYILAFEEINYVYWPELDSENPFESLALKTLSHPLNGSAQNRVDMIMEIVKDYRIDGVVMFSHWGCRHSNGSGRIIKDSLKKIDIPTLILDGDCLNKNNSSSGQITTRLQGFMEIINSRF
ncbi:MAG: 2-hydroxyacyl-CoA dehydratase, partial [Actinobacteria bacterium]|nr:2-hydroxyacyl-CoA dehydratase [Actinomycetota bacterium]